jgi:hypothetical protein
MAIDFDALVLAPLQGIFGIAVTINPVASQRGAAPYQSRGVFASRSLPIAVDDGAIVADQQTTLGIRLADYPAAPLANDRFTINGVTYEAIDVHADGQGGAEVGLRKVEPA